MQNECYNETLKVINNIMPKITGYRVKKNPKEGVKSNPAGTPKIKKRR